jgi:hypothetical protein
MPTAETADRGKRLVPGKRGRNRSSQIVVYLPCNGVAHGVHLRLNRSGAEVRQHQVSTAAQAAKVLKEVGDKCPIVAILPKSLYLLRVFELPKVSAEEVPLMLELEASAVLPPEFGAVEVCYRLVAARKEGYERYEACIARREELGAYLSALESLGIRPSMVLPSAVAWVQLLKTAGQADLLIAALGSDQLEAVSLASDGTVNIRTITAAGEAEGAERYQRGLVECVRPLLTTRTADASALSIGWIGPHCPSHLANGRVTFKDFGEALPLMPAMTECGEIGVLLCKFSEALVEAVQAGELQTSNLLPSEIRRRRQQSALRKSVLWAASLLVLACALAYVAMRTMVHRYQERIGQLSTKIESIRKEGEAVGRRIEQLEAMRAARVTRSDFQSIIAGLYDSSPPNLTYSGVELDEQGKLRLQGQAESLATAFLLPEQLEKNGTFKEVQPGDASRSRKGEGTVVEFRVDCKLNRKGTGQ